MSSIRAAMMGEQCNLLVFDHLDCCVMPWFELVRAPLDLSDPIVWSTMDLWRDHIDRCLLTEGVIELTRTYNVRADLARCLLLDALSRLKEINPNKQQVHHVWEFERSVDLRVTVGPGWKYLHSTGDLWCDWQGVINAN